MATRVPLERIVPREDVFRAGLSLGLRAAGAHCAFCVGSGASSEAVGRMAQDLDGKLVDRSEGDRA